MINFIKIPIFPFGTNFNILDLDKLWSDKEIQVRAEEEQIQYHLFLCDKKELCSKLQFYENLVLLISFEELVEENESLQDIFNLIQFMQVSKVLCLIVHQETIKKPQWKISLAKRYLENSKKAFKEVSSSDPQYNIRSFKQDEKIITQMDYFNFTPKQIDWNDQSDTVLKILSQNGFELDVVLLKGLLVKTERLFLENQKAEDKPIYIAKIENDVHYAHSNQGIISRKITLTDQLVLKDQCLMMNRPFTIKKTTNHALIIPYFEADYQYQEFLQYYKRDKGNYTGVIDKQCINCHNSLDEIKDLEFASLIKYSNVNSVFRVSFSIDDSYLVNKHTLGTEKQINSSLILLKKDSSSIIAYCRIYEGNYTISYPEYQKTNFLEKQMEILYLPFNESDIIQKVQKGELKQEGKHIAKCRICMEAPANCLLLPCSHIRYCYDCASEQQECLFCDHKIESKKKIQLKLITTENNNLLQKLSLSYIELWRFSLKNNSNIEFAEKVNQLQDLVEFQSYFCFKCKKQQSNHYSVCNSGHLLGYCNDCNQSLQVSCLNNCKSKIDYKGMLKYQFEE